ncbi:MAG: hypothetical protein K1X65_23595 [Caldilineales bacterium]|nr:hypothetical protein [Caldilineales bacterium]MCW5858097.1 hypothetical protein [Caldilineales bacterium]
MQQRLVLRLSLILAGVGLLLTGCGGNAPAQTPSGPVNLYTHNVQVSYQRSGSDVQETSTLVEQKLNKNDAVTVDSTGRAHLTFQDFLAVDIFRDSDLRIEALSEPAGPAAPGALQFRLAGGTISGMADPQQLAGERVKPEVRIDTKWAVIRDIDTAFIIHYDRASEQTWVVVKRGAMGVRGAGKEVIVKGGQQTWVEPGKAPINPIPACRNLVGDRFPLIDDLTNDVLPDLDWLCTDSAMLAAPTTSKPVPPTSTIAPPPTKTPTATPRPPTSTPPPTLTPYANFIVDPPSIQACACTNLRWDAGNVASVAIDGAAVPAQGSRQECPSSTTTYNLRAVTAKGAAIDRSASVQVLQPSIDFRADSTSLSSPGECTTLRWDVENVRSVYLDDQGVAGHSNRLVCPSAATTYQLRVDTACGAIERYVTVQAFSDTVGPSISNVRAVTYNSNGTLCTYSPIDVEAFVSDPAGVDRVILSYRRTSCSYDSGGDSCSSTITFDEEMTNYGGNLYHYQLDYSSNEGSIDIKVEAFDRYSNKSESGTYSYDVIDCG